MLWHSGQSGEVKGRGRERGQPDATFDLQAVALPVLVA